MKLTILGSGGPVPFSNRSAPAFLVEIAGDHLLVDCGPGTGLRLSEFGLSPAKLDMILITHLHMDHCHELPTLLFSAMLAGRSEPVHVYAPAGVRNLHSLFFENAYPYLLPLAKQVTGRVLEIVYHELAEGELLVTDEYCVLARRVSHGQVEAYGFRIEEKAAVLAFSGDTIPCPAIIELAKGGHTLVQDCALPDTAAGNPFHATPREVGRIAHSAGIARVILNHFLPECRGKEEEMLASVRGEFAGEVLVGRDLMTVEV